MDPMIVEFCCSNFIDWLLDIGFAFGLRWWYGQELKTSEPINSQKNIGLNFRGHILLIDHHDCLNNYTAVIPEIKIMSVVA